MIRDNQGYGDWITEAYAAMVAEHEREGADMALLGIKPDEQKDLLALANADEAIPDEPPPDDIPPESWGVVVECEDEDQQAELLERLGEEGFNVRALIV
jgi:ParB-like chromosome segregation protein Spo0J